ncbi:MAG: hypothetical protein AAGC57_17870 [Pseudomonadota bacterium]
MPYRLLLSVFLLAVAAAAAWHLASTGISAEAQALIDQGDAARVEAVAKSAEADALRQQIAEAAADPSISRSLTIGQEGGGLSELEARLEAVLAERKRLEDAARALWERAASIDAEAQDAILQRLRDSRPKS